MRPAITLGHETPKTAIPFHVGGKAVFHADADRRFRGIVALALPFIYEFGQRRMLAFERFVQYAELHNAVGPELAVILACMAVGIHIPEVHFVEQAYRFNGALLWFVIIDSLVR